MYPCTHIKLYATHICITLIFRRDDHHRYYQAAKTSRAFFSSLWEYIRHITVLSWYTPLHDNFPNFCCTAHWGSMEKVCCIIFNQPCFLMTVSVFCIMREILIIKIMEENEEKITAVYKTNNNNIYGYRHF